MTSGQSNDQHYPSESAGQLMTLAVPICSETDTVADVKNKLFEKNFEFETINYIYVLDQNRRLTGTLSIKEIFRQPKNSKVDEFMTGDIITARAHSDQEKVAILALKYNLKAVPVVDKNGGFLGVVPSDKILRILHSEQVEDFLRSAGIHLKGSMYTLTKIKPWYLFKVRIPWLLFGVLGGIVAAGVIYSFTIVLERHFIFALFIPLMVYIADATGVQTQTVLIRSLAFDANLSIMEYAQKELKAGILLALALAIFLAGFILFWYKSVFVSLVLAGSLFITVMVSIIIAMFTPWLLMRFHLDPAFGSGPFATIIRDVATIYIYFLLVSWGLDWWGVL